MATASGLYVLSKTFKTAVMQASACPRQPGRSYQQNIITKENGNEEDHKKMLTYDTGKPPVQLRGNLEAGDMH